MIPFQRRPGERAPQLIKDPQRKDYSGMSKGKEFIQANSPAHPHQDSRRHQNQIPEHGQYITPDHHQSSPRPPSPPPAYDEKPINGPVSTTPPYHEAYVHPHDQGYAHESSPQRPTSISPQRPIASPPPPPPDMGTPLPPPPPPPSMPNDAQYHSPTPPVSPPGPPLDSSLPPTPPPPPPLHMNVAPPPPPPVPMAPAPPPVPPMGPPSVPTSMPPAQAPKKKPVQQLPAPQEGRSDLLEAIRTG